MSAGEDEQWPAHQAGVHYGKDKAGKHVDINPLNLEAYPNQKPSPEQPFSLPTERQVGNYISSYLQYLALGSCLEERNLVLKSVANYVPTFQNGVRNI